MDVLDKYKDVWKNQPSDSQTVSKLDIYKLTQQKSTSIVKWIFIIGILEFAFWVLINFAMPMEQAFKIYEELHLATILKAFYVIHYVIIVVFLYYFYRNFSSISVIDDTKSLLNKILKTRKTVKYYVWYNVLGGLAISLVFNILILQQPDGIATVFQAQGIQVAPDKMLAFYIVSQSIMIAGLLLFLFVFYQLLYGILLRKLKHNYKELAKLEASNS